MTTQTEDRYNATRPAPTDGPTTGSFNGCYQDCRCRCNNTICGCHEGNRNGIQREPSAHERHRAHAH